MAHLELAEVLAAARRLSRRDRELIALRVGAGLPYSEVAEQMRMTENAATVATGRALRRLRTAVGVRT
jgi:RNA polymerase sigma-70 factor (ECF subfamily)